jgi:hypothetical protein
MLKKIVANPDGPESAASDSQFQDNQPVPDLALDDSSGHLKVDTATRLDAPPDPFNPALLRLSQAFGGSIGVRKVLITVPCRKPNRQEFIRVRPGEDWRLETGMFEDKLNRNYYLVAPALWDELLGEVQPTCLFLSVNRLADVFLWPCKLPGADGKSNSWNESALAAARLAESKWLRVVANMGGGVYDTWEAADELSEPVWPELSFPEILKLCFRDRFIKTPDHPVVRALRGLK